MLIFYLGGLITALYYVVKLLGPEMAKPVTIEVATDTEPIAEVNESEDRTEKLEILLLEKNKNIVLLQNELKIFHAQLRDFDKVKTLLEEEIHHLKEQNRVFRSELGLPAVQTKENSVA